VAISKKKTKKKGGARKKAPPLRRVRTIQLQPAELKLYKEKLGLVQHCVLMHRACLVDMQVYQGLLKDRYKLADQFDVDLVSGVISHKAHV
jgi:hypothetical protein